MRGAQRRGNPTIFPIISEVLGVLAGRVSRVALLLDDLGEIVTPCIKSPSSRTNATNRILECAVAGKAAAVVTGDKALLALGRYQTVAILSLSRYLG